MAKIQLESREIEPILGVSSLNKRHAYLVLIDDTGAEWVLSAYPYDDRWISGVAGLPFKVFAGEPISETTDRKSSSTVIQDIQVAGTSVAQLWREMCQYAREIDQSDFDYFVTGPNSNTFISALLKSVGIGDGSLNAADLAPLLGWDDAEEISGAIPPTHRSDVHGSDRADILGGTPFSESLFGYSGADWLAGRAGNDILVGGGHGDHYSVGADEGYDIIDDRGGGGDDTLVLYTGYISNVLKYEWFSRDGDDLRVRVPDGAGGVAIDIRIKGMGTSAGAIETVEIWGGEGRAPTGEAWNLSALWEELTRPNTPSTPVIVGTSPTPPPGPPPASEFTWIGSSGDDVFTGTTGRDVAGGLGGADALDGEDGDDVLLGNSGADMLNGGDDDDLLIDDDRGSRYADRLYGGAGDDSLVFYGAPSGERDFGDGGSGRDLAYVDLSDRTRDWQLTDDDDGDITLRLKSGSSEGWFEIENVETIAVLFGSGDDTAISDEQRAYFKGGDGDDYLSGGDYDDFLDGGDGNDQLHGGRGVDWIDGGAGQDYAEFDLRDESGDLTFVAAAAATATGFTFANGTHVRNVERIDASFGSGDDRIWLGDNSETIDGGGGDDLITTALRGQDSVNGGGGYDRLLVDMSGESARLRANFNTSDHDFEIFSGTSYAGASRRIHAASMDEVILRGGSANDDLDGGDGDDELIGNGGDDRLKGNSGDDRLEGGDGDDDFDLSDGADWADGGAGDDYGELVRSSDLDFAFDTRLAASESGLSLVDGTHVRSIERWDLTFGAGDDTVATTLRTSRVFDLGTGGNRLIVDHADESSALIGVADGVLYWASAGTNYDSAADRLFVINAQQVEIYGGLGADTFAGVSGDDVLEAAAGDDVIYGGLGADIIAGGLGQDQIYGQGGADLFVYGVGDSPFAAYDVILDFEAGVDRFDLPALYSPTLRLATGVDGAASFLYADVEGDGAWEFAVRIEGARLNGDDILIAEGQPPVGLIMYGSAAGDTILGGAGGDLLQGAGGDDLLNGGAGADTSDGGAGDDRHFVDTAADMVVERAGEGNDRLLAAVSYALAAGVEVEKLTTTDNYGTAAINLTGNGFDQAIYGNEGANVLTGGGGTDDLIGFGGNDWYYVDSAGDRVRESIGGGVDRVLASASYALAAGVEVEKLTTTDNFGTAAINLTGNAFDQAIYGNDGANVLTGGGGTDSLLGLGGDDWYYVDSADDRVYESAGGGTDRVLVSTSYTLAADAQVEKLTTTDNAGTAAINLTGNAFDQAIYGNDGANVLRGGGGNDDLIGLGGNDFYYVDGMGDHVFENVGGGVDRVLASASFALATNAAVEVLSTTDNFGTVALDLTGSAYGQAIYGNDAANLLDGKGGIDDLIGFGGNDIFAFTTAPAADNFDRIHGFVSGVDRISLDRAVFAALAPGALSASAFVLGAAALDADDRILYEAATGRLFYDMDGSGAAAAVQFATLTGGEALAASDFMIA